MHGLADKRIGPRDDRLASDDGRCGRKTHHWQAAPIRQHFGKRVLYAFRVGVNEGSLTKVVEKQAGKNERKPGNHDGFAAEMSQMT